MLPVLRKHTDLSQWCVGVRIRSSELCARSLRLAILGLIRWFCWYRVIISLMKRLSPTSVQGRAGQQGPLCWVCSQWETLQEGIVFSGQSHAVCSSCVLSVPMAAVWVQVCQAEVLRLGNSSCRCAWSFALMAVMSPVTGRSFSSWGSPTRTSKVLELLDGFVNYVGKIMGVNLVAVEDTKLVRQPSFLDWLQTCQRFL